MFELEINRPIFDNKYYQDYMDISRKQKERDIEFFKRILDDEGCGQCEGDMDEEYCKENCIVYNLKQRIKEM